MSEWKEYNMSELIEEIAMGPFGSNIKVDCFVKKGVPVLNGSNLTGFKLSEKSFNYVTKEKAESLGRSNAKRGDIIVTHRGTLGQVSYIPDDSSYDSYVISQSQFRFSCKKDLVFVPYLVYYFHSREGQYKLLSNACQVGVPALARPTSTFKEISVILPPIEEQKRIAGVLSSLDDKIDLLHRENATLEALAETLFRHYFIENPDPTWKEGKLGDILSVKGGTTPSTNEPKYWNGNIAWTSPRDVTTLNGMYLFKTERTITEEGLAKISSGLLPAGTLLMSSRAPVGVLAFAEIPVAINQGYIAIIDDKGYPKEFIFLWLKENMEAVHSYSNGSTFMEISKTAFKSLDITIPDKSTVIEFNEQVKPLFEKIKLNQQQILSLSVQRDMLLSRLMSGEVKM